MKIENITQVQNLLDVLAMIAEDNRHAEVRPSAPVEEPTDGDSETICVAGQELAVLKVAPAFSFDALRMIDALEDLLRQSANYNGLLGTIGDISARIRGES